MPSHTAHEPPWIEPFLAALTASGIVSRAIEAAGVRPGSVYYYRKRDRRFAERWQAALTREAVAAATETAEQPSPMRAFGWRTRFLDALAETSNVTASAIRAGVPIHTAYKLNRDDPGFAARWAAALHEGYDNLEMEVLGYLRDPRDKPKMDVAAALRLLVAHREAVARERALREDDDEQAVLDSIDAFIEDMRQRRAANATILIEGKDEAGADDGADDGAD